MQKTTPSKTIPSSFSELLLAKPKEMFCSWPCFYSAILSVIILFLYYTLSTLPSHLHFFMHEKDPLIVYDTLLIAGSIFLLTFHLNELSGVLGERIPTKCKCKTKLSNDKIEKIKHGTVYVVGTFVTITMLMLSGLLLLLFGYNTLVLELSILLIEIATMGTAVLITFTVRTPISHYLSAVNETRHK